MAVVKSLWRSIQGDPVFMRRVNGWLTIFWILMIPFSIMVGLLSSVAYVSTLSLWALVSGHWSAWQAARVEVEQMAEAEDLAKNPIEERVVEKLVEETTVEPVNGAPASSITTTTTTTEHAPSSGVADATWIRSRLAEISERMAELQQHLEDAVPTHG
jgi:hypothetical protein